MFDSGTIMDATDKPRQGDPDGRRIARRRANLLSEAGRVARAMEILLQRANYPIDDIRILVANIARQERSELQRAHGYIEPRTRFKASGSHPLHLELPISNLYIDESGKSHARSKSEQEYFALGAVALSDESAIAYRDAADQIKTSFFGRTDFQFHEPFMRHREQTKGIDYSFARNEAKQQEFDEAILQLIRSTEFVTFGVAIRKSVFQEDFVKTGIDPYLPFNVYNVAITLLLERFIDFLACCDPQCLGRVRFESQGPREDAELQLEYTRLLLEGSQWVSEKAFQSRLETGVHFSPKRGSDPSELSDFFARDLFEWTRSGCVDQPKWWNPFCAKVYVRGNGSMGKFGIKIFPDSDIREQIENHRRDCGANHAEK
jgi:hypothetical protein